MLNTLSLINEEATKDVRNFINSCEAEFDSAVNSAVEKFLEKPDCEIVLLAGPSSSGKTTTAGIIAEKIRSVGRNAYIISLDDFYLDRADIPLNDEGEKDYENVTALDLELMHKCFSMIINRQETQLPVFDFKTGCRSEKTKRISLRENDVIIVEGLHALNPAIAEGLDEKHLYKIYISVSSRIMADDGRVLLNKRNLRLIRRVIRDYKHRNSSAQNTLSMWQGVMNGEDKYLFPFESYADVKINSFHSYEACVFKEKALKVLDEVQQESEYYEKAQEIKSSLMLFEKIDVSFLPQKSLLNEFITI